LQHTSVIQRLQDQPSRHWQNIGKYTNFTIGHGDDDMEIIRGSGNCSATSGGPTRMITILGKLDQDVEVSISIVPRTAA
jgi:hypothetical protein